MQYNILKNASYATSAMDGNITIHSDYFTNVLDFNSDPITTLSGTDILSIEFDLCNRINISRFEYRFELYDAPNSASISGVSFFIKDDLYNDYTQVETCSDDLSYIFYTTFSGIAKPSPRYIKCRHIIADTLGVTNPSGIVYGFKAFNADDVVNFGDSGDLVTDSIEIVKDSTSYIKRVPIYNNSGRAVDAIVSLEASNSDMDKVVSIGESPNGPWYSLKDGVNILADVSNFNYGDYNSSALYPDGVGFIGDIVYGNRNITTSGIAVYTSKILDKESYTLYNKLVLTKRDSYGKISVDVADSMDTIEIRSSNLAPKPYCIMRTMVNYSDNARYFFKYRDTWLDSKTTKENGASYINEDNPYAQAPWHAYGVVIDRNTYRYGIWNCTKSTDSRFQSYLYLFNVYGSTVKYKTLASSPYGGIPVNFYFREMILDSYGGMWVYFFAQNDGTSYFVDAAGYYLVYFNSSFSDSFKWFSTTDTIGGLSSNYADRNLWYTTPDSLTISKIDIYGVVLLEFKDVDYTNSLGPIYVLNSGDVVFSNGGDIHYMRESGAVIPEMSIYNVSETSIEYIVPENDGYEFVWIISDLKVSRVFVGDYRKGEIDFSVDGIGIPISMEVVSGGVWVKCSESDVSGVTVMKYISIENRRVDYSYNTGKDAKPGILYIDIHDKDYVRKSTELEGNQWNSVPWKKVSLYNHTISNDNYYQLRISMHRDGVYKAWPDVTLDPYVVCKDSDYFYQDSSTPDRIMWGSWSGYPGDSRVYIDTASGIMNLSSGGPDDTFVSTANRVVYSTDDSGKLNIIVGYKIKNGNVGVATGVAEDVYVELLCVDQDYYGYNLRAHFRIAANPVTGGSDIFVGRYVPTGGEYGTSAGAVLTNYDGELIISIDKLASSVKAGQRNSGLGAWTYTTVVNYTEAACGKYFLLKVKSVRTGSNLSLKYVYMANGRAFNYISGPIVEDIFTQKAITLSGIQPYSSKDVYMRLSANDEYILPNSTSVNLDVKWKVPVS